VHVFEDGYGDGVRKRWMERRWDVLFWMMGTAAKCMEKGRRPEKNFFMMMGWDGADFPPQCHTLVAVSLFASHAITFPESSGFAMRYKHLLLYSGSVFCIANAVCFLAEDRKPHSH